MILRRWEKVDTRHLWSGGPIKVTGVHGRHLFHWRARRSTRFYSRLVRQPYGDHATYRLMVRDRRTGELENPNEETR